MGGVVVLIKTPGVCFCFVPNQLQRDSPSHQIKSPCVASLRSNGSSANPFLRRNDDRHLSERLMAGSDLAPGRSESTGGSRAIVGPLCGYLLLLDGGVTHFVFGTGAWGAVTDFVVGTGA